MPQFGKTSLEKLQTIHSDLQILFIEVIKHVDCIILEGFRSKDAQNEAFRTNKSKQQWPTGKHNQQPSLAVDVSPYPVNWNDSKRFYYFSGIVRAIAIILRKEEKITHEIRWGGDWDGDHDLNDQTFFDLVHFEIIE